MVGTIVYQLTRNLTQEEIQKQGFDAYFIEHTTGVYPVAASGAPFSAASIAVTGDTLADINEDLAAEQKARGADFETGSLMQRAKALVPLLVPLFVSAFRRADELATAMECRCYHGDEGRTKLNVLHYQTRDYLVLGYYAVLVAAVIALR